MYLILIFVYLVFSELEVPLPSLPYTGGFTFPSLRNKTFLVIGCREAGAEIAKAVQKLNANTICAIPDKSSFDHASVSVSVDVMELNFCSNKSVINFVYNYIQKYEKFPDYVADLGISIYNDFSEEQIGCSPFTFISNYILLEKELEYYNNFSFKLKWNSVLLVANTARLPVYQENFNFYKLKNILYDEYTRRLQNVRRMGLITSSEAPPLYTALSNLQMLLFIVYDGTRLVKVRTH